MVGANLISKKLVLVKIELFRCLGCPFESDNLDNLKHHVHQAHFSTTEQPEVPSGQAGALKTPPLTMTVPPEMNSERMVVKPAEGLEASLIHANLDDSSLVNTSLMEELTDPSSSGSLQDDLANVFEDQFPPNLDFDRSEVSERAVQSGNNNLSRTNDLNSNYTPDGKRSRAISRSQPEFDDLSAADDLDFLCAFCYMKFSTMGGLTQHHSSVHDGPSPKRSRTSSGDLSPKSKIKTESKMKTESVIKTESRMKPERLPYRCDQCPYRGITRLHLKRHMRHFHVLERSLICSGCSKECTSRDQLAQHKQQESDLAAGVLNCFKFYPKKTVKSEPGSAETLKLYGCRSCDQDFFDPEGAIDHWNSMHLYDAFQTKPDVKLELDCDQCGYMTNDKVNLNRHKKVHTGVNCKLCKKVFPSQEAFKHHCKERHSGAEGSQLLLCDTCGYSTTNRMYLKHHIRESHNKVPFDCLACRQSYNEKNRLLAHHKSTRIVLGSGKRVTLCQLYTIKPSDSSLIEGNNCNPCSLSFSSPEETQDHFRTKHAKLKLFNCNHCGEDFKMPNLIHNHLLKHLKSDFESVIKHKNSDPELPFKFKQDPDAAGSVTKFEADDSFELPDPDSSIKNDDTKFDIKPQIRKSQPGGKVFLCEFCTRRFLSEVELKSHIASNKSSSAEDDDAMDCSKYETISTSPAFQVTEDKEKRTFICQLCNFSSKSKSTTMSHCTVAHTGFDGFGYYVCSKCKMWPGNKKDVIQHWASCQP